MTLKERADARRLDERLRHAWYRCRYCWWTVDGPSRAGHLRRCGARQQRGIEVVGDAVDDHYAEYDGPTQLSRPSGITIVMPVRAIAPMPVTPEEIVSPIERDTRPSANTAEERRQWADQWIRDRLAADEAVSSARLNAAARLAMGQGFAKATAMTMIRRHREAQRGGIPVVPGMTQHWRAEDMKPPGADGVTTIAGSFDPDVVRAAPRVDDGLLFQCPFRCGAYVRQNEEHNCEANGPAAMPSIGVTATASIAAKLMLLLQGARELGVQNITVAGLMFPVR